MEAANDTHTDRRHARAIRMAIKTVCGVGGANAKFADAIIDELTNPWRHAHDLKARLDASVEPPGAAWREVLMAVAGVGEEPSSRRLGHWFSAHQNFIDEGLVIRGRVNAHLKMNEWWVDEVGYDQCAGLAGLRDCLAHTQNLATRVNTVFRSGPAQSR
jgi:hypothetical protein